MLRKLLTSLLLLSAGFIVGCKAQNVALGKIYQNVQSPADGARVVVFRPTDEFAGSAVTPRVLVNGKDIGQIEPLGYLDAIISPGDTTVALKYDYVEDGRQKQARGLATLQPVAGQTVFLRYQLNVGLIQPDLKLIETPSAEALPLLAKTRRCVNPS